MKNLEIANAAKSIQTDLVRLRRALHQLAEPSGKEVKTSQYIYDFCRSKGWQTERDEKSNAVVATVGNSLPAKVALRADMDALPGKESGALQYAAKGNFAHFCGHDLHIAMLLGVGILADKIPDAPQIKLLFQPHEEVPPGGALDMIKNGVLQGIDSIYALHVDSMEDVGVIKTRSGAFFAAPDLFTIVIKGRGGHAAAPQDTVDSILIASQVIVSSQGIISRMKSAFDPAVLSFTSVHGGTNCNIIPDEVVIQGTIRTYDLEVRENVINKLRDFSSNIASSFGGTAKLDVVPGYIPVINSDDKVRLAYDVAQELGIGLRFDSDAKRKMYGEDFGYFLKECPGALMMIGAGVEADRFPLHNSNVWFNEDVLWRGAAFMLALAISDVSA